MCLYHNKSSGALEELLEESERVREGGRERGGKEQLWLAHRRRKWQQTGMTQGRGKKNHSITLLIPILIIIISCALVKPSLVLYHNPSILPVRFPTHPTANPPSTVPKYLDTQTHITYRTVPVPHTRHPREITEDTPSSGREVSEEGRISIPE